MVPAATALVQAARSRVSRVRMLEAPFTTGEGKGRSTRLPSRPTRPNSILTAMAAIIGPAAPPAPRGEPATTSGFSADSRASTTASSRRASTPVSFATAAGV